MKKLTSLVGAATLLVNYAGIAYADAGNTINLKPGTFGGAEALTIPGLISGLLKLILVIAAVAFFFMLVIGGIQWIVSGGDKAGTEAARGRITAALIGLVVVFAAWAIVTLVNTFFGVDIFSLTIPKAG